MPVAIPAAAGALVASFRGHWILAAVLLVIVLAEAYADGKKAGASR